MEHVAVTGMGIVSPVGSGVRFSWRPCWKPGVRSRRSPAPRDSRETACGRRWIFSRRAHCLAQRCGTPTALPNTRWRPQRRHSTTRGSIRPRREPRSSSATRWAAFRRSRRRSRASRQTPTPLRVPRTRAGHHVDQGTSRARHGQRRRDVRDRGDRRHARRTIPPTNGNPARRSGDALRLGDASSRERAPTRPFK